MSQLCSLFPSFVSFLLVQTLRTGYVSRLRGQPELDDNPDAETEELSQDVLNDISDTHDTTFLEAGFRLVPPRTPHACQQHILA